MLLGVPVIYSSFPRKRLSGNWLHRGGACFETHPLRDAACGGSSGQAVLLSMR
jgi:hypothetical protein